jgi:phosphoesterase RecJ-like protein
MKQNNTFREIGDLLKAAETILIYPHVNMDGDALGSAAALCRTLRDLGKTSYILIEDDIPRNLLFLDRGYCTHDQNIIEDVDISLCLDCGDLSRFLKRKEKFLKGKTSICIDHHRTTVPFCDCNYVDPEAAATGQLIYYLLKEMGTVIDGEIANAVFAAITTDTGNFQYSNTTRECHDIAAELYDFGVDVRRVSQEIYESVRQERILLHGTALSMMERFAEGKAAMTVVTQDMLKKTGAGMDETEGIVDQMRSIEGVEIAILVKEDTEKLKLSLRAKSWGNVAAIAGEFGGGGHTKAAGCSLKMPLDEALPLIREATVRSLELYHE